MFFSFAAILIRFSEQDIGANTTIFNRLWMATILLELWNRITSFFLPLSYESTPKQENKIINYLGILLLSAIVDLMCLFFWAWSLNQSSVTNSNLLHNLTPIFATLGGWLFLNQSFNRRFIIGVILASLGSSALVFSDLQFGNQYLIGDSLESKGKLFYGFSYLIYERLRHQISATTLLF
ncbi:MAG: DMT family transporter [Microcoleaceae cyanobacterium]